MGEDCDNCRAARLRSLAEFISNAPVEAADGVTAGDLSRLVLRMKLLTLADHMDAARASDWDEDAGHLAQAVDAILDSALENFQNGANDQGIALVVGAEATVDELLSVMNLPDADEPQHQASASGTYSQPATGTTRADHKFQMSDGSYPIDRCTGENSVSSAAKLAHHSKTYTFAQVKAHVMKAKNALNCPDSVLPATWTSGNAKSGRPPRDSLVRGAFPLELRAAGDGDGGMPTLVGHFAVFNRWTKIDSFWEGEFMESIARGAFKKTFTENRSNMRCLFQHGRDSSVGDKPLGPIDVLREDDEGGYYEVPLLDTTYNREILPGLEKGLYGASFRFSVMKESINQKPDRSDHNPDGLPERIVQEARVQEFGPVTFPAYADATAGVRSLTDDFIYRQVVGDPERLMAFLQHYVPVSSDASNGTPDALPRTGAESSHSTQEPQRKTTRWTEVSREKFIGGQD